VHLLLETVSFPKEDFRGKPVHQQFQLTAQVSAAANLNVVTSRLLKLHFQKKKKKKISLSWHPFTTLGPMFKQQL